MGKHGKKEKEKNGHSSGGYTPSETELRIDHDEAPWSVGKRAASFFVRTMGDIEGCRSPSKRSKMTFREKRSARMEASQRKLDEEFQKYDELCREKMKEMEEEKEKLWCKRQTLAADYTARAKELAKECIEDDTNKCLSFDICIDQNDGGHRAATLDFLDYLRDSKKYTFQLEKGHTPCPCFFGGAAHKVYTLILDIEGAQTSPFEHL